MVHQVLKTH